MIEKGNVIYPTSCVNFIDLIQEIIENNIPQVSKKMVTTDIELL